jgi:kinetochore protein NDC80
VLATPCFADARCLQDPRPVADKAFVAGCTQALITFLATRGYDRPLSPKLLSSNKEFAAVVAFLARRVDPGAPLLGPRVEEEVPALFKPLRYPFAIPKSALQAVGSPHTWPALVAALAWLVELLRYEEAASAPAGGSAPGGLAQGGAAAATERGFFDFCAASYGAYLAGDDARVAALDAALEAAHGDADAAAADEAARQADANASLDQQLRSARDAAVPLADLGAKKVSGSCARSLRFRAHSRCCIFKRRLRWRRMRFAWRR